jgi:hypothetical protein
MEDDEDKEEKEEEDVEDEEDEDEEDDGACPLNHLSNAAFEALASPGVTLRPGSWC